LLVYLSFFDPQLAHQVSLAQAYPFRSGSFVVTTILHHLDIHQAAHPPQGKAFSWGLAVAFSVQQLPLALGFNSLQYHAEL
jgi:hypothetical protein